MEAVNFSESDNVTRTLDYTGGYIRALTDADRVSNEQFQRARYLSQQIVEAAEKIGPQVKQTVLVLQEADEEKVRVFLKQTSQIAVALRDLALLRNEAIKTLPHLREFWTDEAQHKLDQFRDLFEEAEETLALGLSLSLRNEIRAARAEAGIEDDETGLRAR